MKIIFANGTELYPIVVTGASRHFQGATRDALTFVFPATEDMNALDAAFSSAACESITIVGDDGTEAVNKAYTLRVELCKKPLEVTPETIDTEAVWEDRIFVMIAQRTYMETQMKNMQAAMNVLLTEEE